MIKSEEYANDNTNCNSDNNFDEKEDSKNKNDENHKIENDDVFLDDFRGKTDSFDYEDFTSGDEQVILGNMVWRTNPPTMEMERL